MRETKQCTRCHRRKPRSDFMPRPPQGRRVTGAQSVHPWCRTCKRTYDRDALARKRADAREWADRLAYGIAAVFGGEIGKDPESHPWDEAMSILESACITHRKTG